MKASDFVHLHVHSDNSLLDGACTVESLVQKASACKHRALALTDHGNMCGAVEFYKTAKAHGIKPIVGCEIYLVDDIKDKRSGYSHLTLLARNAAGYSDLSRLTSIGHIDGFYGRPRVDWEHLANNADNLICLSGCVQGPISMGLVQTGSGLDAAGRLADIFNDKFFLEIQSNKFGAQYRANDECIRLSRLLQIPLAATSDVHYIERQDAELQEIKICVCHKNTLTNNKFSIDEDLSYRDTKSIFSEFGHIPHAIMNTRMIADMVDIELEFGKFHLPRFDTPDGSSAEQYLASKCSQGLTGRYGEITPKLRDRLDYELGVINKSGYATYFLVVQDFIAWAKQQGIPVGPGRGSAAGSLASYCLGITDVDPMRHKLLFERFLNPSRVSMPDIDIDFCEKRRTEVIDYVKKKYGEECVSQIITFGKLKARSAIRDVGRVLELPYKEVDKEAKSIPFDADLKKFAKSASEAISKKTPEIQRLYEVAVRMEGMKRHAGKHAAGIVIGDRDLKERIPLYRVKGEITTQYTMLEVEDVGLIKMDFLGLRTLTVIDQAEKLIKKGYSEDFCVSDIPEDDEDTFKLFSTGETKGVFQFESDGMQAFLRNAKPTRLEDIIAMTAIYRPGPLGSDMHTKFADRKNGREEIEYDHPCLEPILNTTYGGIIYQEQVMRIANEIAGFTLPEADTLRKAMGKKKIKIMEEMKPKFITGCVEISNMTHEEADDLWTSIEYFSQYGFNLSHAVAYGTVSYRCAYLKTHYPVEFMAAVLTSWASTNEKMPEFITETRLGMGIKLLPPHINLSEKHFKPEGDKIRFGFEGIKGIGEAAISSILKHRGDGYLSLYDFCERTDSVAVSIPVVKALVVAKSFDDFGDHSAQLFESAAIAVYAGKMASKSIKNAPTKSMFSQTSEDITAVDQARLQSAEEWSERERLNKEKGYLGIYLSGHPAVILRRSKKLFDLERGVKRPFLTTKRIKEICQDITEPKDSKIRIPGIIQSLERKTDKHGNPMAFVEIQDDTGTLQFPIFKNDYRSIDKFEEEFWVIISGQIRPTSPTDPSLQFYFGSIDYVEVPDFLNTDPPAPKKVVKKKSPQGLLFGGSEDKEFAKSQGKQRYESKRKAGISKKRYDGSETSIDTDIEAAAAEKCAADYMGQSYNDKIMTTGDGGQDFSLNLIKEGEKGVEVVWLGKDKETGKARETGHLIVNPEEPQRWADIYMVVSGSLDEGFRIRGWTSHKKLTSLPKKDFGYGKKFSLHIDMLWEMSALKKLL